MCVEKKRHLLGDEFQDFFLSFSSFFATGLLPYRRIQGMFGVFLELKPPIGRGGGGAAIQYWEY